MTRVLALCAVCVLACSSNEGNGTKKTAPKTETTSSHKPKAKTMSTCTDTIRRLMAGHLDQPVTSGCTRADVVAVLGSDGSAGAGRLSNTERKWLDYEAKHTRAWFDDDDHLLMLVVTKPSV